KCKLSPYTPEWFITLRVSESWRRAFGQGNGEALQDEGQQIVKPDDGDQFDCLLVPESGDCSVKQLVAERVVAIESAHDLDDQPLAGCESVERAARAHSLYCPIACAFCPRYRLVYCPFVLGPVFTGSRNYRQLPVSTGQHSMKTKILSDGCYRLSQWWHMHEYLIGAPYSLTRAGNAIPDRAVSRRNLLAGQLRQPAHIFSSLLISRGRCSGSERRRQCLPETCRCCWSVW